MNKSIKSEVFWKNPGYKNKHPLKGPIECEYLIVGGGITGVSLAYFLSKCGKSVVLAERGTIASGATGHAAGLLTPNTELDLRDLIRLLGETKAVYFWHKLIETLYLIEKIVAEEKIECEFEREDTFYAEFAHKEFSAIAEEYQAMRETHVRARMLFADDIEQEFHTKIFTDGILSHIGASMNPLMLSQNLSTAAERHGAKIFENTPVLSVKEKTAFTPDGSINFKTAIFATDILVGKHEIRARKTTIAVSEKLDLSAHGIREKTMIWDAKKIYDYAKITKDGRLLVGYGDKECHTPGSSEPYESHLKEILSFTSRLFPANTPRMEFAWSGVYGVTDTLLPFVEVNDGVISVGGTGGQLLSIMVAKALADMKVGRKSRLLDMLK
jgi:glycine/D-amino acid oxidase-like deaminating enzyme